MAEWHGYFVVERGTIGAGNWDALIAMFENMGEAESIFPAYNNHWRPRPDGDAVIYESQFDTEDVCQEGFQECLADEFGVDIEDIEVQRFVSSWGDYATTSWEYSYPIGGDLRFTARRFGQGGSWEQSRNECLGYLAAEGWDD